MLEARYHRLVGWREFAAGPQTVRTIAGEVLCGCGSCGDVLAMVTLTTDGAGAFLWAVQVRRGYSQVTPGGGVWRWSRHAQRSHRGAAHHALRERIGQDGRRIMTAQGDWVVIWPTHTRIVRGMAIMASDDVRPAAVLRAGESLTIGCQQASPHLSRLSYEGLMREKTIRDLRLESA